MACKQPQEKHRRLQESEMRGEVEVGDGMEGGSQSGCMA